MELVYYPAMDPRLIKQFQRQVLGQCRFILLANEDLSTEVKKIGRSFPDMDRIFMSIQGILTASANVSKALWGQSGKYEKERELLRESIGIADDSALRQTDMRNNWDHFDDRLDRWWRESSKHNVVDFNVITSKQFDIIVDNPLDYFRVFNWWTGEVYFWGDSFNLVDLLNEVVAIVPKLSELISAPLELKREGAKDNENL